MPPAYVPEERSVMTSDGCFAYAAVPVAQRAHPRRERSRLADIDKWQQRPNRLAQRPAASSFYHHGRRCTANRCVVATSRDTGEQNKSLSRVDVPLSPA